MGDKGEVEKNERGYLKRMDGVYSIIWCFTILDFNVFVVTDIYIYI